MTVHWGTNMHPAWELSDDRKSVTMTLPVEPAVELKFGTQELDELLEGLGRYRAAMDPPVSIEPARGPMATVVTDTTLAVEEDTDSVIFNLRDPRFGWLHYRIPNAAAASLSEALRNLTSDQASGSGTDTIN